MTRANTPIERATILVIEDDAGIRTMLELALEQVGYRVITVAGGIDALATTATRAVDAILLDLRLGAESGATLARDLRGSANTPLIMMTAGDRPRTATSPVADAWLEKPFTLEDLYQAVAEVLSRSAADGRGDGDGGQPSGPPPATVT